MKKVIVGVSGGVDSAVALYLLKNQGYEVEGLFMRNWDSVINNDAEGQDITTICPQEQDYNDALALCNDLNVKLHRIDFIKEYWDYVFKYFLDELKKGRTPNPDMLCNRYIKFDYFLEEAKKLGADYIATGHYAKLIDGKLYQAKDKNKDQTYFLADVKKENFSQVIFPLGDLTKEEVRKIANENHLNVANKKDSTGICFIGERNFQKFVANYLKKDPGPIIDVATKKIIGEHQGLMNYTIGQRRNVGISGNQERHFVCGKDVFKNILYVTIGDEEPLFSDECIIDNLNWLCDEKPHKALAKFRYRGESHEVELEYTGEDEVIVRYKNKAKAVTPGQACVLYNEFEECLGCGFIKTVKKENNKLWYLP